VFARFSGPKAVEVINGVAERLGGASVVATSVVPDSVEAIQEVLKRWSDVDHVNLILTTGILSMSPCTVSLAAISVFLSIMIWNPLADFTRFINRMAYFCRVSFHFKRISIHRNTYE